MKNEDRMSIRVLIVEDEPVIATDIEMTLTGEDYDVVGIAYTSTKAIDMLHRVQPDLVLLDIAIKGDRNGIDIARIINDKYHVPFIYITSFSDRETLERAKATLPYGYIVKPFKDSDIISAIQMAIHRHATDNNRQFPSIREINSLTPLTKGEYQVMKCVWEGSTNLQVTEQLHISLNTVKTHLKSVFIKLEVNSRSAAIAAIRNMKRGS